MLHYDNLHQYQLTSINKMIENETYGLFLDMGLGKTVSSLTAIKELYDDFAINKVLVIAPLRVSKTVWHSEAKEWSHLKDDLTFSIITGNLEKRLLALQTDAIVYTINRENIPWLVEHYKSKWPFDMIVIDESSSFKNPTSKRFRSLKEILKYTKHRYLLTGTPSPNGLIDLWSQIYILDEGERLGKNITRFRNTYFEKDFMGYNYSLKEGSEEIIIDKIKDKIVSMNSEDYLNLPELIPSVVNVPLEGKLLRQYKQFEEDMITQIADNEISAVNAATLSNKLLQFSSGAIYDEDSEVHHIHDLKFEALDEIIEYNPDTPILVAYNFKHELDRLLKRYPQAESLHRKWDDSDNDRWNNNEIPLLFAHPASAGHGLNLQKGDGHIAVWLGFNWSLELYQQFNKRLHRQGQKQPVSLIHIAVGDIEYRLMRTLTKKDITQKELLEALK